MKSLHSLLRKGITQFDACNEITPLTIHKNNSQKPLHVIKGTKLTSLLIYGITINFVFNQHSIYYEVKMNAPCIILKQGNYQLQIYPTI